MIPILANHQRILVAPLHWGLGHATRCIPIIDHLLSMKKDVAIAGDSESFGLLKRRYPNLDSFELPSYKVEYSGSMTMSMLLQGPKFMITYRKEIKATNQIVKKWNPDVIISDNRFGVRNEKTDNIYLTHQLNIQHKNKMVAGFANLLHRKYIHQFDECWVPDDPDQRLSGRLSDSDQIKIPTQYIGGLTRLDLSLTDPTIDTLIILSGPEPARTDLEKSLVSQLQLSDKKIALVRGTKSPRLDFYPNQITVYDIVDERELTTLINASASIVSRSGYSTIMDLQKYDRPIYYIPTKGQTEQEYLADYHDGKGSVTSIKQIEKIDPTIF